MSNLRTGFGCPLKEKLNLSGNLKGIPGTRSVASSECSVVFGLVVALVVNVAINNFLIHDVHLVFHLRALIVGRGVMNVMMNWVDKLLIPVHLLHHFLLLPVLLLVVLLMVMLVLMLMLMRVVILIFQIGDPLFLPDAPGVAAGGRCVVRLGIVLVITVEEVEKIPGGRPRRRRGRRRGLRGRGSGGGGRRH